jgi:hypothetical protein
MFNQTLRNICSFFSPGKKSIFSSGDAENTHTENNKTQDTSNVRLLYHRDRDIIESVETKTNPMQHDWWIN